MLSTLSSCWRRLVPQAALVGFRWWEAGTLANSGAIALGLGKLDDAASSVREALSL